MKKFVLPQLAASLAHLCATTHSYRSVNSPSRGKTYALTMQQFFPRVIVLFLLMQVSVGAWAQNNYVFSNGTYGYLYNDNGALKSGDFAGAKSVWTASDELGTTSRNIKSFSDNSKFLYVGANNGGAVSLGNSDERWQYRTYLTTRSWNTNYYFKASSATSFSTASGDNGNRYTPYSVSITEYPEVSQITGIDGADAIGKADSYNYTKIGEAKVYPSAYKSYSFNTSTYYEVGNDISTTAPTGEEFTYTWSATCSDASYTDYSFSNGTLTITATPETDKEITITLTATKDGQQTQTVTKVVNVSNRMPTGVDGEVVTLNDYEDHNWSYYKGLDYTITNPDGSTISYKDKYRYSIYSPDPRNVKITYRGYDTTNSTIDLGGTSKVGIGTLNNNTAPHVSNVEGEGQNTFVYYETLEKFVIGFFEQHKATNGDWDGTPANPNNTAEQYPYTVISNPFSVRPSTGSGTGKKYYGFAGWKIISGGEHIQNHANNDVLALDEIIHFTDLENIAGGKYTPNCTSAEVVLEATWTQANVQERNSAYDFGTTGTYETNFIVATGNIGSIEQKSPCTIMAAYYPDGTANTNRTITGLTVSTTGTTPATNTVKVEYIRHGNGTFNANGNNMILGRGTTSNSMQGTIYCSNANKKCENIVKVESGNYSTMKPLNTGISSGTDVNTYIIFGCDYDKSLADYSTTTNAYNTKLQINGMDWSGMGSANRSHGELYIRTLFKSGKFTGSQYYAHTASTQGQRFITIEGGYFTGNITCGSEVDNNQENARALTMRIRGNAGVDGRIAGGSTSRNCSGDRCIVLTGGQVAGWIAAGSNSNNLSGGVTNGISYVYIGGNAQVNSNSTTNIGNSSGGVIYGAGCGIASTSDSGQMTKGSNVVLADDAYVERGIYGGGAMGKLPAGQTANMFVLGGHIGIGQGSISDNGNNTSVTQSGVFGGACNVGGGYSNIYMNGGIVEGGVFGGSNISGTMANDVKIQIEGGQVGTDTLRANVHGGGYGKLTLVNGDVDVTIGKENATEGATIYGDVYGGSALGQVNATGTVNNNALSNVQYNSGKKTNVTLNAGTINGSLYGGALGSNDVAANVYGPVQVTVNGGSVKGENSAVYGCNNVNGAPQSTVKVDVYKTDAHNDGSDEDDPADDVYAIHAVYGGGNQANYTYTATDQVYPQVTVHNCDNSIKYVYGGGNQATVPGTKVDIYGGNIIGNVFGGGNNANVTTNGTDVNIYGGTILNVYGGNNNGGAITGTINVDVAETKETTSSTLCPVNITDLYGGGNIAASAAGNITIGKCSNISNVYGGANQANVTGPITLDIVDGNIGTVFGGNNNSGTITGAITVNVNWNGSAKENESDTNTRRSLGSVYGGGNKASYTGNPTVNFTKGITTGSVFGGGLGKDAIVTGNPAVNIGDWATKDDVIIGGDVFGGGDLAAVEGNPSVTVRECGTIIEGDLYGGGNAAPVYSTTTTVWGGNIKGNVFGGGNGVDRTKNEHGAQVGYKSGDTETGGSGNTVTNIYGGTIGTWTTDSSTGVSTCQEGTGGIFGGSNTNGNIRGTISLNLDEKKCTESGADKQCTLTLKEVYGAGNQAAYAGSGITFTLGCVSVLGEIYGGAKQADLNGDVHLKITSGHFDRVCGGNNLGGKLNGSIKVTVDETGCSPVTIDELYGGGNQAAYSIYGYNDDGTPKTSGENPKADPEVNIVSCTSIGQVFGGGLGSTAVMVGNPKVNINMIEGAFSNAINNKWNNKLGTIDNVYGGGNAAKVVGDTHVNIGTKTTVLRADGTTNATVEGVNISGNVYGGGNQADVTGKTHVQVGAEPATTTP